MASSNDAWAASPLAAFVAEAAEDDSVVVVVGATASGKTELAIRLAEELNGEIVNVDSVQIYRHFDIGSGKPTAKERQRAVHHLVDLLDPLDSVDASRFRELADVAIADIRARGKRPILSGGTFLFHRAVLFGLADAPSADPAIRARHRAIAESAGRETLHTELRRVDPESAERIHPNDLVRVSRALEVFELSGKKMSDLHREHAFKDQRYPHRLVAIRHDEAELRERIECRAKLWLDGGWIPEVERLVASGYGNARAMESVGYREVSAYLRGEIAEADLLSSIVRATRIFVRRQKTWLGHSDVLWLDAPWNLT